MAPAALMLLSTAAGDPGDDLVSLSIRRAAVPLAWILLLEPQWFLLIG